LLGGEYLGLFDTAPGDAQSGAGEVFGAAGLEIVGAEAAAVEHVGAAQVAVARVAAVHVGDVGLARQHAQLVGRADAGLAGRAEPHGQQRVRVGEGAGRAARAGQRRPAAPQVHTEVVAGVRLGLGRALAVQQRRD